MVLRGNNVTGMPVVQPGRLARCASLALPHLSLSLSLSSALGPSSKRPHPHAPEAPSAGRAIDALARAGIEGLGCQRLGSRPADARVRHRPRHAGRAVDRDSALAVDRGRGLRDRGARLCADDGRAHNARARASRGARSTNCSPTARSAWPRSSRISSARSAMSSPRRTSPICHGASGSARGCGRSSRSSTASLRSRECAWCRRCAAARGYWSAARRSSRASWRSSTRAATRAIAAGSAPR